MTPAKDGFVWFGDHAAAGMQAVRCHFRTFARLGLMLGVTVVPHGATPALAHNGPIPALVSPACRVVANQAMRISESDDPEPMQMVEIRSDQPITANRSASITSDPAPLSLGEAGLTPQKSDAPAGLVQAPSTPRKSPLFAASGAQPKSNNGQPARRDNNDMIASIDVQSHRAQLINVDRKSVV